MEGTCWLFVYTLSAPDLPSYWDWVSANCISVGPLLGSASRGIRGPKVGQTTHGPPSFCLSGQHPHRSRTRPQPSPSIGILRTGHQCSFLHRWDQQPWPWPFGGPPPSSSVWRSILGHSSCFLELSPWYLLSLFQPSNPIAQIDYIKSSLLKYIAFLTRPFLPKDSSLKTQLVNIPRAEKFCGQTQWPPAAQMKG